MLEPQAEAPLEEVRLDAAGPLELRSESERVVSLRLVRWGELGDTPSGWEAFERGAFDGTDEEEVYLRLDHEDPAVARGVRGSLEERADGAYMDFGPIVRSARGDETLAAIRPGPNGEPPVYRGASVGFSEAPGGTRAGRHTDGRRINYRTRVRLNEVGITWRPVFPSAGVLQVRSAGDMTQDNQAAATEPVTAPPVSAQVTAQAASSSSTDDLLDRLMTRLEGLETRARQEATGQAPAMQAISQRELVRAYSATRFAQLANIAPDPEHLRALSEITTATNMGVVPDAVMSELLGPISARRPFLETTRNVPVPSAGTKLIVPRIITRPIVGNQAAEKDDIASGPVQIDSDEYGMETIAGGGDLSIQLITRSTPEFQELYFRLLGEAMAKRSDLRGLVALLVGGINMEGVFDPESPAFGTAYTNAVTATDEPPNRIWLSAAAYAAFVDAKEPAGGGGRPLYPGLAGITSVTAGGPAGPDNMSLTPVIVPMLDALKAAPPADLTDPTPDIVVPDIIIGPSSGFAWAEDGAHRLEADNPAQAGRDVALVSMLFYAAVYPGAFSGYTLS